MTDINDGSAAHLVFVGVLLSEVELFQLSSVDGVEVVADLFPRPRHASLKR